MKTRSRWVAGLAAAAAMLAATVTVSGYTGQVDAIVGIAAQGTITCAAPFTVTATILDSAGAPVPDQSVAWSFDTTQSASDRINKTPTVTNAKGVATTTVTLGAVSGERQIRAAAGDVTGTGVVDQTCISLPRTDSVGTERPSGGMPIGLQLVLLLAGIVGGAAALRRRA